MSLFKQIKVLTPESVELEFTLAGIGSRALALVIDYQLLAVSLILFWILWDFFTRRLLELLDTLDVNYSQVPIWLAAIAFLVTYILYTGYFVYFEVVWQGQTPGKRFAKIRVIRDNGTPVGLASATLRSLLRPLDDLIFIGAFLIFWGRQEKRLGDLIAGTLVIQEERPTVQTALTVSDAATALATELPQLTELSRLQPDDFAIVSEFLRRRPSMSAQGRAKLSRKLADEIQQILRLEHLPDGATADLFLEAVYLAYQNNFPTY
ncbi:MAG: RDD family protein [Synechococcales cyanobacterium M58_A2018_015]|nr:RDD family protein [Synechococcales cyanobacterium M58_A2018_015]